MEHSKMFAKIKDYYDRGLWTYNMVYNAVLKEKLQRKNLEK